MQAVRFVGVRHPAEIPDTAKPSPGPVPPVSGALAGRRYLAEQVTSADSGSAGRGGPANLLHGGDSR